MVLPAWLLLCGLVPPGSGHAWGGKIEIRKAWWTSLRGVGTARGRQVPEPSLVAEARVGPQPSRTAAHPKFTLQPHSRKRRLWKMPSRWPVS